MPLVAPRTTFQNHLEDFVGSKNLADMKSVLTYGLAVTTFFWFRTVESRKVGNSAPSASLCQIHGADAEFGPIPHLIEA